MSLYEDERTFLQQLQERVKTGGEISQEETVQLLEKFEEMIDITSVSMRIIDRLRMNYDRLKQDKSRLTS